MYSNNIIDLINALSNLHVYVYNDTRDPVVGIINAIHVTNRDRYNPLFEENPLVSIPYQNEYGKTSHVIKNITIDPFFVYSYVNNYKYHVPWFLKDIIDMYH